MNPFGGDSLFGGGMHPMLGFSSFNQGGSANGGRSHFSQRMEVMTQTVNGVTHTVRREIDSEVNLVTISLTWADVPLGQFT